MKEETYVKLLDTFTWTVVGLLAVYVILWLIENYNTKSIDLTVDNNEIEEEPVPREVHVDAAQPEEAATTKKKAKGKKQGK